MDSCALSLANVNQVCPVFQPVDLLLPGAVVWQQEDGRVTQRTARSRKYYVDFKA